MINYLSHQKGHFQVFLMSMVAILLFCGRSFAIESFYTPTEVLYHNNEKAYEGYTIFSPLSHTPGESGYTYLINMDGQVLHKWGYPPETDVSYYGIVKEDGNLYRALTPHYGVDGTPPASWMGIHPTGHSLVVEDWEGNQLRKIRTPHKDMMRGEALEILELPQNTTKEELAKEIKRVNGSRDPKDITKKINMLSKYDYIEHHDVEKIWNKKLGKWTVLFIALKRVTPEQVLQGGAKPVQPLPQGSPYSVAGGSFPDAVTIDAIVEVDFETGEKVWEWWFWDHMIQNTSADKDFWYKDIADKYYDGDVTEAFYRRLDVNVKSNQGVTGPIFDWSHVNSLDYNAERDEIVINSRHLSEIYVIDHSISEQEARGPKGDFLYRWGSPSNYASIHQLGYSYKAKYPNIYSAEKTQIWGAHDVQWIDPGLPGEGHLLIYDNGIGRIGMGTFSAVLEWNPLDENGNYVKELEAGYRRAPVYPKGNFSQVELVGIALIARQSHQISNQIVWGFSSHSPQNFYSPHISGAQRLPNGNTLICSGHHGHIFEVTEDGEVVWEYISPVFGGIIQKMGSMMNGKPVKGGDTFGPNSVFRAYRFGLDYAGWKGRDFYPQNTITGRRIDQPQDEGNIHYDDTTNTDSVGGY